MNSTSIGSFLLLAVPAFFTPGPNNMMLMTSSAKFGLLRTLPHAIGYIVGYPLMVFAIALGLGEIFVAYPLAKTALKLFGAAYLMWMAWCLLGLEIGEARAHERPLYPHEAVLFQWINPKGWVMGVTFAAAFVPAGPDHFAGVLGITLGCLAIAPLASATWMVFGERLHALLKRTGTERFLGTIMALLMLAAVVMFFI